MHKVMNYDPNMNFCGRCTKQTVRLVFGRWRYRKEIIVEVLGNCTGLTVIDHSIDMAFEKCWPDTETCAEIAMEDSNGDVLFVSDDDDHGEEWLKKMLISAEIISIQPAE